MPLPLRHILGRWKGSAAVADPRNDDIVFLVLGKTGAGKSTFINSASRTEAMSVGHDPDSCTTEIAYVPLNNEDLPKLNGRRLLLVDTPGLDHTYLRDTDTSSHISLWLAKSYPRYNVATGVIYLHDISSLRSSRALETLKSLQEKNQHLRSENVVIATTKWNCILPEQGETRERSLIEKHWSTWIQDGAIVMRCDEKAESALKIVEALLNKMESNGTLMLPGTERSTWPLFSSIWQRLRQW